MNYQSLPKSSLPKSLLPWKTQFEEQVKKLVTSVEKYLTTSEVEKIQEACIYGAFLHHEQARSSGEPYIFHPIEVAQILTEVQIDSPSIIGAILHDAIEDTDVTAQEISEKFGAEVAHIVEGVSKLTQIKFGSKEEAKAENLRKMILAMTQDIRVIMVKLADRLHNMRTLGSLAPYKKKRIAKDTLEIYAPISARLGMYALQVELENLCFQNLYPLRHQILKSSIDKRHQHNIKVLEQMQNKLNEALKDSNIQTARISARKKHLWSIYKKLKVKGKIEDVLDIFAIRILVRSVDECYLTLGIVHRLFKPIMGKFKDYIAIPKANGYQSLHTIVFGINALAVEVQIRTRDMHVIAEAGAAAHWRYKDQYAGLAHNQMRTQKWLHAMQEMQQQSHSSVDFMEVVKADLFPDEIYIFTPKGKIIELPKGATVVDFAYAIHSDIGNHCVSAKVNRNLVPLRAVLKNGQTVEITTAESAIPNPSWLNFVVTAKARAAIHHHLNHLKQDEAIIIGRKLLDQALITRNSSLQKQTDASLKRLIEVTNLNSLDQLFEDIGFNRRSAAIVANRLLILDGRMPDFSNHQANKEQSSVMIKGAEDMLVTLGRCCLPLPGDPIMGFLTVERGIVIHKDDCSHIKDYQKNPDKWIDVEWEKDIIGEFPVALSALVINKPGALASLAASLTQLKVNIDDFHQQLLDEHIAKIELIIKVQSRQHLAETLLLLRDLPVVKKIARQ